MEVAEDKKCWGDQETPGGHCALPQNDDDGDDDDGDDGDDDDDDDDGDDADDDDGDDDDFTPNNMSGWYVAKSCPNLPNFAQCFTLVSHFHLVFLPWEEADKY